MKLRQKEHSSYTDWQFLSIPAVIAHFDNNVVNYKKNLAFLTSHVVERMHNYMFTQKVSFSARFFCFYGKNMVTNDVVNSIETIAQPIAQALSLELVEVEFKREGRQMVLRIFVDREGGITLDDCAAFSRELSTVLDIEDTVPGNYTLEVSSPGLNRPLKTVSDYERFSGRLVKIRTFAPVADEDGNLRKTFLGDLLGMENDLICLKLREGQRAKIPLSAVAKSNLEFEF